MSRPSGEDGDGRVCSASTHSITAGLERRAVGAWSADSVRDHSPPGRDASWAVELAGRAGASLKGKVGEVEIIGKHVIPARRHRSSLRESGGGEYSEDEPLPYGHGARSTRELAASVATENEAKDKEGAP
jgi:hypothetical protein